MAYKIGSPTPPSDMFVESLTGGGAHHMNCGFCGRDHFCPDSDSIYYEDKDDYVKDVKSRQEKDPEGTILHFDIDGIDYKDLNGMTFVIDCPCNGLALYEKFIWMDRNSIRRYLEKKISHEYDLAQQELTKNKLAGIEPDSTLKNKDIWGYR